MDIGKTLKSRFLCGVSVWSMDVQYYCYVYVVHVVYSVTVPMVMCNVAYVLSLVENDEIND